MKKIKYIFLLLIALFLIGCDNAVPKTEYYINEKAIIDDIEITLVDFNYIGNDVLELVFDITNKRDDTISIDADNNFKFYDINETQLSNIFKNNPNIIKTNKTIKYTLQYNINKKDIYSVLFYSGIVTNNIKFTITSNNN